MKATSLKARRGGALTADNNGGDEIALTPAPAGAPKGAKAIQLVKLERAELVVNLASETGLIVHEFSEKSIKQMLDKQMKKTTTGRQKKDPFDDFKCSLYKFPDGKRFGFPARGFKACFVRAANDVDLVKTEMKRALRVLGTGDEAINVDGLIEITAPALPQKLYTEYDHEYLKDLEMYHALGISMRRDIVRLETGVADIRFRAYFPMWKATVRVQYNKRAISEEQLLALIDAAGFGVGIGEWRPGAPKSESGQFGCFCVKIDASVEKH